MWARESALIWGMRTPRNLAIREDASCVRYMKARASPRMVPVCGGEVNEDMVRPAATRRALRKKLLAALGGMLLVALSSGSADAWCHPEIPCGKQRLATRKQQQRSLIGGMRRSSSSANMP